MEYTPLNITIYGIECDELKPNYKYCELHIISTFYVPKKHVDTGRPYRCYYYFSKEETRDKFAEELAEFCKTHDLSCDKYIREIKEEEKEK